MKKRPLHRSWDILSQSVHGASCSMIEHGRATRPRGADFSQGSAGILPASAPAAIVGAARPHRPTGKRQKTSRSKTQEKRWNRRAGRPAGADLSECLCRPGGIFSAPRSGLGMAGAKQRQKDPCLEPSSLFYILKNMSLTY